MVDRDKAIEMFREYDLKPTIRDLSEGSDEQVEIKIQQYLMKLRDRLRWKIEEVKHDGEDD